MTSHTHLDEAPNEALQQIGRNVVNFQKIEAMLKYLGNILRIDPLGNNSANGEYGVPADNPFFPGEAGPFGGVGQHGSIALIERFILSLKNGCTRIVLVPLRTDAFHQELTCFANWYNQSSPHSPLSGKTPHEVYHDLLPACERPRYEPRAQWPCSAPCASPHAPVASHCGAPIRLDVRYHWGRKHLPIVALRRAA